MTEIAKSEGDLLKTNKGIADLKVAKFYRHLYSGEHKLAPHYTNVCKLYKKLIDTIKQN